MKHSSVQIDVAGQYATIIQSDVVDETWTESHHEEVPLSLDQILGVTRVFETMGWKPSYDDDGIGFGSPLPDFEDILAESGYNDSGSNARDFRALMEKARSEGKILDLKEKVEGIIRFFQNHLEWDPKDWEENAPPVGSDKLAS